MIKNLVVNLSVSANQGHAAEDFAISMAGAFGAHVTGIAFIYDTHVPVTYPQLGYGEAPAELIDALKREQTDLAKQASQIHHGDVARRPLGRGKDAPHELRRVGRSVRPDRAPL